MFHALTNSGEMIHAHVHINGRFFGRAAGAEVAHYFANNARVGPMNESALLRFQFNCGWRGLVLLQLAFKGIEIGPLRVKHLVPFAPWCAGGEDLRCVGTS